MAADLDSSRHALAALADRAELCDAIVDGARARSPEVAALPRQEVTRHVSALISSAVAAFIGNRGLHPTERAAAARLGADRAEQGVPLAALLDGFQAGRAEAIRLAMAEARTTGFDPATLLDAILELDALITDLEHQMTHAHHAAELDRARTAREQRAGMLRQLLVGGPEPASGAPADALAAAGLDPAAAYRCVVSAEHDPTAAYRLEARLCAAAGGVYGLLGGCLVGVTRAAISQVTLDTLLVVGPPVPVAELAESYRMCCAARSTALADGTRGVVELTDLAVDSALAARPGLGRLLAGERLSALRPAVAFHRELVATALAHLDSGGRLEATAAALHVHPNTVKYRLRRLRELTGFRAEPIPGRGGAVRHAVHWWWALRTWQGTVGNRPYI